MRTQKRGAWFRRISLGLMSFCACCEADAQYAVEYLDRGLVAVRNDSGNVFLSWRYRGTDTGNIAFNVYRGGTKINVSPITSSTNYVDSSADTSAMYSVRAVLNGTELQSWDSAKVWQTNRLEIPLVPPAPLDASYRYNANDCSVADLDGDGQYEIILKWDPSNSQDNSLKGITGNVYLDAYKLNGARLWRIDLGRNIRAGAHYTQFIAYDLNGDGRAEVACRTSDGTVDGLGKVIGDSTKDYRNANGYILTGPEWLTVFDGRTGGALASTTYYPQRHPVYGDTPTTAQINTIWGDNYGNRIDRFLAGVAYLDGKNPSLIMSRGYYSRAVVVAWDWNGTSLKRRWVFDTNFDTLGNSNTTWAAYRNQGAHSLSIGDLDGDGKDEILYGACAIDDDGRGLYSTGLGHGDALHLSDMDPDRPGLEWFMVHETQAMYGPHPKSYHDAKTGAVIFGGPGTNRGDVGRGMASDIDPRHKGYEVWSTLSGDGIYNNKGVQLTTSRPSVNAAIWWDGDLTRELLDGTKITKWDWLTSRNNTIIDGVNFGLASNNTTKANPCLSGDILGDWREEVIWRKANDSGLVIFTTTVPTQYRIMTLMHDPQYREAIAWQNVAYNQPPHPSFYLGDSMSTPPRRNLTVINDRGMPPAVVVDVPEEPTSVPGKSTSEKRLMIYPNPGHDAFRLEFASSRSDLRLRISTATGQLVTTATGDIRWLNELAQAAMRSQAPGASS